MTDDLECTCPANVAHLMAASIRGEDTTCPQHRPASAATSDAAALNSDALTNTLAAKLGGTTTGAQL